MEENLVHLLRENADSFGYELGNAWPDLYRRAADEIEKLRAAQVSDMDKQKAGETTDPMASIHWLLNSAFNIALNCDVPKGVIELTEKALGDLQAFHE